MLGDTHRPLSPVTLLRYAALCTHIRVDFKLLYNVDIVMHWTSLDFNWTAIFVSSDLLLNLVNNNGE